MSKTSGKEFHGKLNTDQVMLDLWEHLCQDFRTFTRHDYFSEEHTALKKGIKSFRAYDFKRGYLSPPTYFKCRYQLEALFKRYRFKDDTYSEEDLVKGTFSKFLSVQETRLFPSLLQTRTFKVLQRARVICRDILGEYSEEEHFNFCRFGKRASVANKYRDSYLEIKAKALSCSHEHSQWFYNYLEGDSLLKEAICEAQGNTGITMVLTDELDYTLVPKSFKSKRGIMPNTTIGGFYSYGLGRCIRERLKKVNLNVKKLQIRHGRYAKKYSISRSHATADLSSASDSFTCALVNRLLPRKWYNVLKRGRISRFRFKEKSYHMSSFMTMGIGFTFELQTLLFYSILKAISSLSKVTGTISVYGDDLIYPSSMHLFVSAIFDDLGFTLNQEKTYVKENFRESCGSDYYCGFDVRPFQPEAEYSELSGVHASVFLYKLANGLQRRWSEHQIASTLDYLRNLLLRYVRQIIYVPEHYPDTAGWKTTDPPGGYLYTRSRWYMNGNWTVCFPYITLTRKLRRAKCQTIYYWNSLRPQDEDWDPYSCMDDVTALIWKTPKGARLITCKNGVRVRKMVPFVIKKGQPATYRVSKGMF